MTDRRVRVLTLTDYFGRMGGAEHTALQIAQGLAPDRFESYLCATRWAPGDTTFSGLDALAGELRAGGVKVIGLGRSGKTDVAPLARLVRLIRAEEIAVVHAHGFGSNVWASVLGRLAGAPVVVAHEHSWSFEQASVHRLLKRRLFPLATDAYVAVSPEDRDAMLSAGLPESRVRFLPNGVDVRPVEGSAATLRAELDIPADAPLLVSIGSLRPQKGYDVLIDAARLLRATHPGVRVLIAGSDAAGIRPDLEALIASSQLDGVVHLLGDRQDVGRLLAAADVAVTPSRSEGMPLSVMEYMGSGVPIVATRVGGIPEVIEDGAHGVLVHPEDPVALAAALSDVLADPAAARRRAERAAERWRTSFTVDRMVRRVEQLYTELLVAKRPVYAPASRVDPREMSAER